MRDAGLERALKAAGGVAALAAALGLTKGAVSQWRRVPAERAAAVARVSGVPLAALRPDLGGVAEAQAPVAPRPDAASLAKEARALGLDPDAIAREALRQAVSAEKGRRWAEENREAIEAHNRWVEEHGLPLAEYRMF